LGSVAVLAKGDPNEGNTLYAQGGIASVTGPDDTFESHIKDTLECGAGLCDKEIVDLVVRSAPKTIEHLAARGAKFDLEPKDSGGKESYQLGREGGHSERRILHAGDHTGAEIQKAMYRTAAAHPNITFYPQHIAIDFLTADLPGGEREVLGVYALDVKTGRIDAFGAQVTMLASGGVGKVYLYTSNPDVATGDGIAMAYRAGAKISNMEFIQFHPTCLYHPKAKSFLLTEALRGEGAKLMTIRGDRFMKSYHPMEELAPRDVVARAIDDQMKRTGDDYVLLDISHREPEFIRSRFPTVYAKAMEFGFDLTKGPVPVVPAAHYCCGGVQTDSWGQTNLKRLYCAGETACTGLHGANRLASNSLLEAMVFGERAAIHARKIWKGYSLPADLPEWDPLDTVKSKEEVLVSYFWDEVRRLMWNLVGIVRSNKRLQLAESRIALIKSEVRDYYWKFQVTSDLMELRNIIQVAEIIVCCAGARKESRGLHYSLDFPTMLPSAIDTVVCAGAHDRPTLISS